MTGSHTSHTSHPHIPAAVQAGSLLEAAGGDFRLARSFSGEQIIMAMAERDVVKLEQWLLVHELLQEENGAQA